MAFVHTGRAIMIYVHTHSRSTLSHNTVCRITYRPNTHTAHMGCTDRTAAAQYMLLEAHTLLEAPA